MATPGKQTARAARSFEALSNDELGAIWVDTLRSHAVRRTKSTRDYWRQLLNEDDVLDVLAEFKRRVVERQEEYDAWVALADWPTPYVA